MIAFVSNLLIFSDKFLCLRLYSLVPLPFFYFIGRFIHHVHDMLERAVVQIVEDDLLHHLLASLHIVSLCFFENLVVSLHFVCYNARWQRLVARDQL